MGVGAADKRHPAAARPSRLEAHSSPSPARREERELVEGLGGQASRRLDSRARPRLVAQPRRNALKPLYGDPRTAD